MELEDKLLWRHVDSDPPGPAAVSVHDAMVEGRRRRRNRTATGLVGAVALATAAVLAGPAIVHALGRDDGRAGGEQQGSSTVATSQAAVLPAGPPPGTAGPPPANCTINRLPTPPGVTMAIASGIDPSGRYAVGRTYRFIPGGIDEVPTIWHDGTLTPVPLEGADPILRDATSAGHAVGISFPADADGKRAAWLYRDGQVSRLPGEDADAAAINSADVVVGSVAGRPAVWTSPTAEPTLLSSQRGWAAGIDEDGTIVGSLDGVGAVVWYPDGSMHELPAPPGVTGTNADGLDAGWATGAGATESGFVGLRWNVRTGASTTYPLVDRTHGASQDGSVIGTDDEGHPLYLHEGSPTRLPTLTTPLNSTDNFPNAISRDGRTIAGQAVLGDADRTFVAVLWTCN